MVISKLDKKEKEVLTVIGTDNFSDGFREMRDSLLEIKQDKEKFLKLLEEVHFDNYRKSFIDKLEESTEEFFNKKLKEDKDDIYSIYNFFGKNYKITSKKNGFVKDSIKNLEISDFHITKTIGCTNNHSYVKDKDGHSKTVYFESVYFKVDVKSVKFDSEFEKNIPVDLLKKFDNLLVDLLKKSIEDKVRELLVSDYTLDDVTYKIVPLSLLTDNEIKSTLFDLSYKYKFNFSSIDEVIANTKDISQIDRLFVLMREVVLEN